MADAAALQLGDTGPSLSLYMYHASVCIPPWVKLKVRAEYLNSHMDRFDKSSVLRVVTHHLNIPQVD